MVPPSFPRSLTHRAPRHRLFTHPSPPLPGCPPPPPPLPPPPPPLSTSFASVGSGRGFTHFVFHVSLLSLSSVFRVFHVSFSRRAAVFRVSCVSCFMLRGPGQKRQFRKIFVASGGRATVADDTIYFSQLVLLTLESLVTISHTRCMDSLSRRPRTAWRAPQTQCAW